MIENLKKILSREGGREYVQPSKEEKADFLLRVREHTGRTLDVGRLSLRKGTWHFEYTEDFRRQTNIRPIVNFPHPRQALRIQYVVAVFRNPYPRTKAAGNPEPNQGEKTRRTQ